MKIDKKIIVIACLLLFVCLVVLGFYLNNKEQALDDTVDIIDIDIDTDDGDLDIDFSKYKEISYKLDESIDITTGGVYRISGTIEDGSVTVNTTSDVKLILDNVNITNSSGPAIYIKNANNTLIYLEDNSINFLEDGTSYDLDIGVIYSADDLIFDGHGSLFINSNNEDGIVSKDDLKFISGTYTINSLDDGIRGKDSVYILNGTYNIISSGDGIKSSNDTDTSKGFIKIVDGNFNINSSLDGIQAESKILIENGTFNITTGGGSSVTSTSSNWGNWGLDSKSNDTESAKGIKAVSNIVIKNGIFNLDTSDDAIHSNNYLGIKDGEFNISSGDDGIHADEELIIDGGNIDISNSYEGLEASKITINDGNIEINSSDDGINVAGGNDSSSMGRPGENNFSSSSNNKLIINGGNINVFASGDGLDANGSIYITGGTIYVYGPTNDGNGSLDYDNILEVTGGTLVAGGSSGMLQGCSSSSTVTNMTIVFTSSYDSEDTISIVDSTDNEIINYKSNKNFNSLVVASNDLIVGNTYIIKVNGETYKEITIDSLSTSVGNNKSMNNINGRGMKR